VPSIVALATSVEESESFVQPDKISKARGRNFRNIVKDLNDDEYNG
jgi:hypothetical protein